MNNLPITSEENKPLNNKKEINLIKALSLLFVTGAILFVIASFIGYMFFWNKPAYKSMQEFELESTTTLVKEDPGNPALRVELGWNYLRKGQLDAAEKEFKNALKLDDKNIGAKINLGMVYTEKGDFKKANSILQEALKENSKVPDIHLALGQLYLQTKEFDKAIDKFNFLLKLTPGTVDYIFLIGEAYKGKGEIEQAKKYYEKALSYVPDYSKAKEALINIEKTEVKK